MLQEQISADLKEAMKAHDERRVSTLRLISAACKNAAIEKQGELVDADVVTVLAKQAKQRRDSITQFTSGGRSDLAEQESAELVIIEAYLPKQMSEHEIEDVVRAKMAELGVTDATGTGKLMGSLMQALKGKADGTMVKSVVERLLKS